MYKIDRSANRINRLPQRRFSDLGFREREHLQEWLMATPDALGEELLIIQKEFDGFDDTRERLDLLALDKEGRVVVIENKLDDSGRDVVWQSLKYAAYCSSLTTAQIVDIFQRHVDRHPDGTVQRAEEIIAEFLGVDDLENVILNEGSGQRIILVAANFRKEVTATVMWLRGHGLSINCIKVTPYSFGEDLILDAKQIIPIPEAEDFMIGVAEKEKIEASTKDTQRRSHQLRQEYWTLTLEALRKAGVTVYANISPSRDNWIMCGAGVGSGCHYSLNFTRSDARVQLNLDSASRDVNKNIFDRLLAAKDRIEERFGAPLEWSEEEGRRAFRVVCTHSFDGFNRDIWPEMIAWMVEHHQRLEKALQDELVKAVQGL